MIDARLTHCRSCEAPIIWLKTTSGASMPTDPEGVAPDDTVFNLKKHVSHWATCPTSDYHRKPSKKQSRKVSDIKLVDI